MKKVTTQEMKDITDNAIYSHVLGFVFKYQHKTYMYDSDINDIAEIKPQNSRPWSEHTIEEFNQKYPTEASNVQYVATYVREHNEVPSCVERREHPYLKRYEFNFNGEALGGIIVVIAYSKERATTLANKRLEERYGEGAVREDLKLSDKEVKPFNAHGEVVYFWDGDY